MPYNRIVMLSNGDPLLSTFTSEAGQMTSRDVGKEASTRPASSN